MKYFSLTTGSVNIASMDKYCLEGDRVFLFGLNDDEDKDTFIQFNWVEAKKLWLGCWYVSGRRANIGIYNTAELKKCVKDILQKWNWEERKKWWKMINGETTLCDIWKIDFDGNEYDECEGCMESIYPRRGEQFCETCKDDPKNYDIQDEYVEEVVVNGTFTVDTTPSREQVGSVGFGAENIVLN
jgi:hypothetical protein